jgi:hypothetical protein
MYKQVEKELSEIKKPEEDRLKKAFERLDVDRDGESSMFQGIFGADAFYAHIADSLKVKFPHEICTSRWKPCDMKYRNSRSRI